MTKQDGAVRFREMLEELRNRGDFQAHHRPYLRLIRLKAYRVLV